MVRCMPATVPTTIAGREPPCGVERTGAARTLVSLTNFYALEYRPTIATCPDPEAVCRALAHFIAAERPRWNAVHLSLMPTDVAGAESMLRQLQAHGFGLHRHFQYENWHTACSGEAFESYYAQRPSQLRNTIGRRQKKLEKAYKVQIRVVRGMASELDGMIGDFITVYNSSWKQPEPFPEFIPALARHCATLGILRLGVLYVDSTPAAAQLWITAQGKATIYKLAYYEKYAEFGVGSILSRELFRIAMDEDRVEEIDYGVGSEAYKKDWMSSVRQICGVRAFNMRTPAGLLHNAVDTTKAAIKKWKGKSAAVAVGSTP